jgi:hypothetical protein
MMGFESGDEERIFWPVIPFDWSGVSTTLKGKRNGKVVECGFE